MPLFALSKDNSPWPGRSGSKLANHPISQLLNSMNAVLIIDKAAGLTSHDVVNRVRRILQERSVGHLGTLDPLATGVLPLDQVCELATRFRGLVQQTPPPFSAKKIQGVPAYKLARKHAEVSLQPVQVEIKEFEITRVENDRASFRAQIGRA